MHLAQGKIAKHKPEAFSKLLLNLVDDGVGVSAMWALVVSVLHHSHLRAFKTSDVVFDSDGHLKCGHNLLFRQILERLQNPVRTGIHGNRRAIAPGDHSLLVDDEQSAIAE